MRTLAICGALMLLMTPTAGAAALDNLVEVCGSRNVSTQEAVRFCRLALNTGKLEPRAEAQVRTNMGVGLFDLGRYAEAAAAYTAALEAEPQMVAAYINRARAYDRLNRLGEAAADYTRAIELEPRAADAYLGRGAMLVAHGDPMRAIPDLNTAIRLEPKWTAPVFNRGLAFLKLGEFARALEDFSHVLESNPDDAIAWMNRGRARWGLREPGAAEDFNRAVELEPESAGVWFVRGQYHDEQGRREKANADFLRAYELGYADPWLIQRVREISG